METLILNGSPRPAGDTVQLLQRLTGGLQGTCYLLDAYRCGIAPCVDCRYCWQNDGCCIDDKMQEVYAHIVHCDNILIASPVYFSQLTGPLLSVASRLQTYFCARHFRHVEPIAKPKKGAVLLVGGGDGCPQPAYATACDLLRHMRCQAIHPLVCSHNTNLQPAVQDMQALEGVRSILRFFNDDAALV